jgi:ATP-dependent DNA helicase RecQ
MDSFGISLRGRIAADAQAEPGRAVARLDGLGWSGALRDLFDTKDADGRPTDGETPVPLRTAAVRVLDDWDPTRATETGRQVDAVVSVRSTTRPLLVDHLAAGLARYLGVPLIGSIGPVSGHDEPGRHDVNSAMRLAGVEKRLTLELSDDVRSGLAGKSVLLVDDYTDSGWTITVAARLLRQAGASAVHPFVLGVR